MPEVYSQGSKNVIKGFSKGLNPQAAQQIAKTAISSTGKTALSTAAESMTVPGITVNPTVAGFVNRNKTLLYRLQRTVGISPRVSAANLYRWGAQPNKKTPRPALRPDKSLTVMDFTQLAYQGDFIPPLPIFRHSKRLYRGLGLRTNGAAIQNILQNGFLIKDVGPHNNDQRLAMAGAAGWGAIKAITQEPVINLTNSPDVALYYALHRKSKGLAVIVSVINQPSWDKVVTVPEDIPASDIFEVIALLQFDGIPVWCKIEMQGKFFKITPYLPPSSTTTKSN